MREKIEFVKDREEALRFASREQALNQITRDGEKGLSQVMYMLCDNYSDREHFVESMLQVAERTAGEWERDTKEQAEIDKLEDDRQSL